jgi:hypothetical protein
MKTIDLVYFNAGGGHRAAAQALQAVIAQQGRPWQVRLINLSQVLDPQDSFRRVTGFAPEDLYNQRLQRGWTLGLAQELKLLQGMIRLTHKPMLRTLRQHWARTEPDLVVSLVPNFNRVLFESVASALPGVRFVTVLTDMADLPPHFWIEPDQDQSIVCGTRHALEQARRAGYGNTQLALTSGMVLRPSFYGPPPTRSRTERLLGHGPANDPLPARIYERSQPARQSRGLRDPRNPVRSAAGIGRGFAHFQRRSIGSSSRNAGCGSDAVGGTGIGGGDGDARTATTATLLCALRSTISSRPSWCSTSAVRLSTQSPSLQYSTPSMSRISARWMGPQTTPTSRCASPTWR